jgi:hypothetical protein
MDNFDAFLANDDIAILMPLAPTEFQGREALTCSSLLLSLTSKVLQTLLEETKVVTLPFSYESLTALLVYIKSQGREIPLRYDREGILDPNNQTWIDLLKLAEFLFLPTLTQGLVKKVLKEHSGREVELFRQLGAMQNFNLAFYCIVDSRVFCAVIAENFEMCVQNPVGLRAMLSCLYWGVHDGEHIDHFTKPALQLGDKAYLLLALADRLDRDNRKQGILQLLELCEKAAVHINVFGPWKSGRRVHGLKGKQLFAVDIWESSRSQNYTTSIKIKLAWNNSQAMSYVLAQSLHVFAVFDDGSTRENLHAAFGEDRYWRTTVQPSKRPCSYEIELKCSGEELFGSALRHGSVKGQDFIDKLHPRYFVATPNPCAAVMKHLLSEPWCYEAWRLLTQRDLNGELHYSSRTRSFSPEREDDTGISPTRSRSPSRSRSRSRSP